MNERELNNMDAAELDRLLDSPQQRQVRGMVRDLAEDVPSLAWRSALNQRVLAEATRNKRRRKAIWVVSPSLGLGIAAALAVVIFLRPHSSIPPVSRDGSVEASVMAAQQDTADASDVAGPGLTRDEATSPDTVSTTAPFQWNQDDVDSL